MLKSSFIRQEIIVWQHGCTIAQDKDINTQYSMYYHTVYALLQLSSENTLLLLSTESMARATNI